MKKIPVNIITGGLGVGKTTTICHLLSIKPLDEKWAILVNEFGTLGIDGAILSSSGEKSNDGVTIRELTGGCMCCTLSGPLSTSIASLVRQAKPDRLIIEPSGLGHPAGLLDALLGPHLSSSLDVRAVLCLVDVASTSPPSYRLPSASSSSFSSYSLSNLLTSTPPSLENVNEEWIQILSQQLLAADIVIGHRTDAASSDQIDRFLDWVQNDLWPPKDEVVLASHGRIPLDLLDRPRCAGLLNRALSSSARPRRRPVALRGGGVLLPAEPRRGGEELRGVAAVEGVAVDSATVEESGTKGNSQSESKTIKGEESFLGNGLQCSSPSSSSSSSSSSIHNGPEKGKPVRFSAPISLSSTNSAAFTSCGWLFHMDDSFDRSKLSQLLECLWPAVVRLKGIFRIGSGKPSYVVPERVPQGEVRLNFIGYRRESRLEMIVSRSGMANDPNAVVDEKKNLTSWEAQLREAVLQANWDKVEQYIIEALV